MDLVDFLDRLRTEPRWSSCITEWRTLPARDAVSEPFPLQLHRDLVRALRHHGIDELYSHQAAAFQFVQSGQHTVVVTPTASGKTLCFNLPVLNRLLREPGARALYLFPTKALAQDQYKGLQQLIDAAGAPLKVHTYDGDTPSGQRQQIRRTANIVVTNPDMLHAGILPHHTKWHELFGQLEYIVIDEMHGYRGVFGSHVVNLIRRLKRICSHYDSNPRFILASATIANPAELARQLIEEEVALIDCNGAPSGRKEFIFYNPPVVNRELGIRQSVALESSGLAAELLRSSIHTIVFARTRRTTEVILTYLREQLPGQDGSNSVRGYRGGYLPGQRREIERGLRNGEIRGVVSTNALELGVDIGWLDACIMTGYPGTIASTWQQAGRSGRRDAVSAAIVVASSSPLDQFIVNNSDYFFGRSPERGMVNPDNLLIVVEHLKCAAFELPFQRGEDFGSFEAAPALDYLTEFGVLHQHGDAWYWMDDSYPAEGVSLRTAARDNVVIVDRSEPTRKTVIGEVDIFAAPGLVHPGAIYLHDGQQYLVDRLDWDDRLVSVHQVDVNYYTEANRSVSISVVDRYSVGLPESDRSYGEVLVSALVTRYKKIKLFTHENLGWGDIELPEQQMHTTAYWTTVPEAVASELPPPVLSGAIAGLANLLGNIAPLYVMCDPRDIGVYAEARSPFTSLPTVFIYDNVPGGIGFSDQLFEVHDQLLIAARDHLRACQCQDGCPSCVGVAPGTRDPAATKASTAWLLDQLIPATSRS